MKERSQHLVARPAPPRHLALLAVVLVVVVGALLVFISLGAQMMVSTQAYITAEGHYIKAQKDAVRYLERYIRTGTTPRAARSGLDQWTDRGRTRSPRR